MNERDMAITPDGKELYYSLTPVQGGQTVIMVCRETEDGWTRPEPAGFSGYAGIKDVEPCISPDGSRFFFVSDRPDSASGRLEKNWDIWIVDRTGEGWGKPWNPGAPVNTTGEGEYFPSVTREGTLYFTRSEAATRSNYIMRSRWTGSAYTRPEKLPDQVNAGLARYNAFIAPDESYIIVPMFGGKDNRGGTDYYIVYRTPDDHWSDPVNLGDAVNSPAGREWAPYVTLDGSLFFFMSDRTKSRESEQGKRLTLSGLWEMTRIPGNGSTDIYWIRAGFIERLRPEGWQVKTKK
jgi:hypothetical protein